PDHPRRLAGRDRAHPQGDRQDHRLRHPRHRGGAAPRHRHRDPRPRAARAIRRAARSPRTPGKRFRARVRRDAGDRAQAAVGAHGARPHAAGRDSRGRAGRGRRAAARRAEPDDVATCDGAAGRRRRPGRRHDRARRSGAVMKSAALWLGVLFAALLFGMPSLHLYERDSFVALFLSHAGIVAVAMVAASIVGIAAAVFVTRPAGRDFRTIADTLATIGQTFPPAAVLALAVPALGFGPRPTIVALFLYGLLPILGNAIAGLETVPASVRDAAAGMGMSAWQILTRVELPLAAPVILAGIRVAVTIGIGTATIGS